MTYESFKIGPSKETCEKYRDAENLKYERSRRLLEKVLRLEDAARVRQVKADVLLQEIAYNETNEENYWRMKAKLTRKIEGIERRAAWSENHKELAICLCSIAGVLLFFGVALTASLSSSGGTGMDDVGRFLMMVIICLVPGCFCGAIAGCFLVHTWDNGLSSENYRKLRKQLERLG